MQSRARHTGGGALRQNNVRQTLLNLLKLAIGLGLLYFLYTRLHNSGELWRLVVDANKLLLVLATLTYAAAVALSGLKWGVLLRAAGVAVTTGRLLTYQWMAEFFNAFLPAQVGGDIMRVLREESLGALADQLKERRSDPNERAKARHGEYDMERVLVSGIDSWSYGELTPERILKMEEDQAERLHREILDFSLPPLDPEVAERGKGDSSSHSTSS